MRYIKRTTIKSSLRLPQPTHGAPSMAAGDVGHLQMLAG